MNQTTLQMIMSSDPNIPFLYFDFILIESLMHKIVDSPPTCLAVGNASGTSGLLLLAEEEAEAMARLDGGEGTREAGGGARDGRRRPDPVRGGRIRASGFRSRRRRRQGSLGRRRRPWRRRLASSPTASPSSTPPRRPAWLLPRTRSWPGRRRCSSSPRPARRRQGPSCGWRARSPLGQPFLPSAMHQIFRPAVFHMGHGDMGGPERSSVSIP